MISWQRSAPKRPTYGRYDCFESFGRDLAAILPGRPCQGARSSVTTPWTMPRTVCGASRARSRLGSGKLDRADEAIEMCSLATVHRRRGRAASWMIVSRARELYRRSFGPRVVLRQARNSLSSMVHQMNQKVISFPLSLRERVGVRVKLQIRSREMSLYLYDRTTG